jgi:hypothetical protein
MATYTPTTEEANHRPLHFAVDGHGNRDGNDFVARLMAREIAASGMLAASVGPG